MRRVPFGRYINYQKCILLVRRTALFDSLWRHLLRESVRKAGGSIAKVQLPSRTFGSGYSLRFGLNTSFRKTPSSSSLSRSLQQWAVILASRWVILPNALLIRRGRYVARGTGRMPLGGIEARGGENVDVFLVDVITHFPVIALPVLQLIHRETMPLRLMISEGNI